MSFTYHNWDNSYSVTPKNTYFPHSLKELVQIIKENQGRKIRVSGSVHAFNDISVTDDVMIRTNKMYKLLDTNTDDKTATVEAGCILITFLEQIADFGMALHDIPEGVRQTVAGAMSTGSHGSHHEKGSLSEAILEMTVVMYDGTVKKIDRNNELFSAFTVSLGALGIIYSLKLKCVELYAIEEHYEKMPWNEFLDKLNNTLAEFPFCQALLSMKTGIVDIMYRKKIVTASKETKNIYYNVIGDKYLNTPYAEIEIAVPYDKIRKGIVFILTTLRQNENFRKYLHKKFIDETLLLRFVGKNKRSLIAMTSDRDLSVFFSMVGDAKRSKDPVLLDIFRIFHDYFVNELKGRPHYGKHNFLTTKEMKRLYPKFNKFKEIMEELDPNKVFVNDYIERLFYQPIKLKNKYIISRNK